MCVYSLNRVCSATDSARDLPQTAGRPISTETRRVATLHVRTKPTGTGSTKAGAIVNTALVRAHDNRKHGCTGARTPHDSFDIHPTSAPAPAPETPP